MFAVPAHVLTQQDSVLSNGPTGLVQHTAAVFWSGQQQLARLMRLIAQAHEQVGAARAEFVGDDLAAMFCLHPATGTDLVVKAVRAAQLPGLLEGMEALEITDRHVHAVTGELSRWDLELDVARQVVSRVLDRTREWVAAGRGRRSWPTPGELKRKIRAAVLLHDAQAAKKARDKAVRDRGAELFPSGLAQATVALTGPEASLLRIWAAIQARAHALGQLPGDQRSNEQLLFDAAEELLCADADHPDAGQTSRVPAGAADGTVVPVWVRGVQLQLVVPYSISQGMDCEVAEVPGYGPVLPATARELMHGTSSVQRIAVDSDGSLIGVDDRTPVRPTTPDTTEPDEESAAELPLPFQAEVEGPVVGAETAEPPATEADPLAAQPEAATDPPPANPPATGPQATDSPPEGAADALPDPATPDGQDALDRPSWGERVQAARERLADLPPEPGPPPPPELPDPGVPPSVLEAIQRLTTQPLPTAPPAEDHYRPSGRLARHVNARDRTCRFPGCPRPAIRCDRDHRIAYPDGPTCASNLHAVCRRHHRAKQVYFTVTLDPDTGDTIWRTPDGREYRRPPPDY